MKTYHNPIIPGFYPDPSICRVGEDYYLVNSSFEFFPGVPLWHSRDLVNWEQLGYVLTRESQLPMKHVRTSGGIFAPTIRYHNGRFYMITTNVTDGGNFFVWTDDINGEWSDPVWIDHQGIDPSLFWDDDGKVYYTGTTNQAKGIAQFEIDLETGAKLSETKIIWEGTGGKCPEGPHMYKINGWYYLMIAEGGTEYGHMETIARSRSVWGPFETCPHNPIVSYRNDGDSEFQAGGHADIVTDTQGKWWVVFHAIRPSIFMLHHIGRETMLAPLEWDENGWPVVDGGESVPAKMRVSGEGEQVVPDGWCDDFSTETLHPRWSWLYSPDKAKYAYGDGLTLHGGDSLSEIGKPTFLGVRQQQFNTDYETVLRLKDGDGCAGITVFHTKDHHYDLLVRRQGSGCVVQLRRHVVDMEILSDPVIFENTDTLMLRMEARRLAYTFHAGTDAEHIVEIGKGSSQLLSTEMMICTFTGCFAGVFAEGDMTADIKCFSAQEK